MSGCASGSSAGKSTYKSLIIIIIIIIRIIIHVEVRPYTSLIIISFPGSPSTTVAAQLISCLGASKGGVLA